MNCQPLAPAFTFAAAACLVAVLSAVPPAAQAQSSVPLNQRPGLYLGASLGATGVSLRSIGRAESGDPKTSGVSTKVRAGYWFDKHWGVEASVTRLGQVSQAFEDGVWRANGHALQLSGLGRVALATDWTLIGKLSVVRSKLSDDGSSGNRSGFERFNGSKTSLGFGGVGLEYTLNEHAALTLEIDGLGVAGKSAMPMHAGVGVRWGF